ncbi:secreted protein containing DUF1566 [Candidatus Magnetobacterium bavaricum]|uniref:Secreted protein containing DUF1566 n=1 Tax=Candidatus Magnetobacterium bavaricum TaxID=29290 RepID=A0A0F3GL78_9BACT|nr:secreted protein containing DUF1566 [Candidatus Magnetobacterium bavaricum]
MRVKLNGLRGVLWINTLIIAMLFLALSAHAGTVNLPQTGQTTSYAVGDDGWYKAGVAWPNPRFTDNGDQTVTDNLTGLVWTKDLGLRQSGGVPSWNNALNYAGTGTDWRLPNVNELSSLFNASQHMVTWLNSQGFITNNMRTNIYWSSTTLASNTYNAWFVDMYYDGSSAIDEKIYGNGFWLVRSGTSAAFSNAAIWKTGQTTAYGTGDDGTLQKGVTWPSPRFTASANTVTDNLTGLMWTKDANLAGTVTWQGALDYVASMNSQTGTYGYTDWRLPNKNELSSLIDHGASAPALQYSHPFVNVQSDSYWSSTTHYNTPSAWLVSMGDGYVYGSGKSSNHYVWPVRAGQVNPLVNLGISKTGTGSGTVTSSPSVINCGSTCSFSFPQGMSVTLTSTVDSGSTFTGWSGDCSSYGSSSTCTLTMSAAKNVTATFNQCTYAISPTSRTSPASGGSDIVSVTATTGCGWTASSNVDWITITSGSSGSGNGSVSYTVAANTTINQRTGTLTIAGKTFTVTQEAITCTYTVTPPFKTFVASGGSDSISVTPNNSACTWTATSNVSWIAISSGSSGTGTGTVNYTVAASTSLTQRTGTITVAGQTFTVTQDAVICAYTIAPTSKNFTSSGGSESVSVSPNNSACTWTAVSNNTSWITITSGSSGTGTGTVNYTVAANTSLTQRTGTLTIAGQTFNVSQDGITCAYSLSATSKNFTSSGGSDNVTVTTNAGCTWSATSNASTWLTVSPASGTGTGSVTYTATANTSTTQRTGTLTIAGQTFTVTQDGQLSCTSSISPTSGTLPSAGGSGTVTVSVPNSACVWTVISNDSWLTISPTSGSGPGTVTYTALANTSASSKTATLMIAGQTFTVTQEGTCGYTINPATKSFTSSGGTDTVSVTANSGCTWTAASNVSWITVSSGGSGTGNGAVSYTVAANTNTSSRTGSMTIAGQTFTVTQAGVSCGYTIDPTNKQFKYTGGTGSVNIATTNDCKWTAVSNDTWVTITSGSSGSGNATVNYSVAANTGASRTGTMTIGGQTFTVSQGGQDCATGTSISPISKNFTSSGGSDTVTVTPPLSSCQWTATSNVDWIDITSGDAGTGPGQVSYTVPANTTTSERTGTMTIAGQTFTVTQGTHVHLTVSIKGTGTGSVSASTGTLYWSSDGKTGTAEYDKNTQVVLTAASTQGTKLTWTGCDTNTGSQCMVKMIADKDITVEFSLPVTPIYDFDGDGYSDVLWRNTTTGDVFIWLMKGTNITGGDYVVKGITEKWGIKGVADFNGDGKSDIIWQHKDEGDVYMYIMDGTKIITHGFALRGVPREWDFKAAGDFDGDGKADILWQNSETGDTAVWFMDGKDIKSSGFIVRGMRPEWVVRVVADLNGDKKDDIVWQNTNNGDVFVWLMDGATILKGDYASPGVPGNWKAKAIADFDGDGKSDILWQDTTSGDVAIWQMDGVKIIGGGLVVHGMLNWHVLAVADYNGDGKADVLWQNRNTGDVYGWIMDGINLQQR